MRRLELSDMDHGLIEKVLRDRRDTLRDLATDYVDTELEEKYARPAREAQRQLELFRSAETF